MAMLGAMGMVWAWHSGTGAVGGTVGDGGFFRFRRCLGQLRLQSTTVHPADDDTEPQRHDRLFNHALRFVVRTNNTS